MATAMEKNSKFYLTVGPVARNADILTRSVKGADYHQSHLVDLGCMLAEVALNLHRLKAPQGDELPFNGPSCLFEIFSYQVPKSLNGKFYSAVYKLSS